MISANTFRDYLKEMLIFGVVGAMILWLLSLVAGVFFSTVGGEMTQL